MLRNAGVARAQTLRRTRRVAALTLMLIAIGIMGVTPDGTGFLQPIDSWLSGIFHVSGWRPTALGTALGSPLLIAIAATIALAIHVRPGPSIRRPFGPVAIAAIAGAVAWVPAVMIRRPSPGHLGDLSASNAMSFPSIPAAMVTGLAIAFLWQTALKPRRAERIMGAVTVVCAVILFRLATACSWPLDELAGAVIGAVVAHVPRPRVGRDRSHRHGHSRRVKAAVALTAVVALLPATESYADIMTAPGSAPFDQRSVEWLRDHGMTQLIDRAESWWLWLHLPSSTATISRLPPPPLPALVATARSVLPPPIVSALQPALTDEGRWHIAAADVGGAVQIATASFRPDPAHPSLVAGAAWINAATTRATLIAGTRQPGGGAGPAGGHVPQSALDSLLAAFNSGYKMKDTPGGALMEGRTTGRMVAGLATLAIDADGTPTVGEWGKALTADQGYTGLRQNLHLMVAGGEAVDGVATNAGGRWGTVRNTLPTWRSGLGVTSSGDLVYLAGNDLTLGVLASAMVQAGAVDAMELDIHRGMVSFNIFSHNADITGHKLLPDMTRSADRYLTTDWRDFIMVTSR